MERLIIGEVLKPQGIRGELKIKTFTDYPEDVKAFKTVYIDDTPYKILSFRVGNDGAAFIGLRGIPDRNATSNIPWCVAPSPELSPARSTRKVTGSF